MDGFRRVYLCNRGVKFERSRKLEGKQHFTERDIKPSPKIHLVYLPRVSTVYTLASVPPRYASMFPQ